MKRIALVGNALSTHDRSAAIDACDHVVRFDDAAEYGSRAGSKLDDLFLTNWGCEAAESLDDPAFPWRPAITAAERIVLPLPQDSARRPARSEECTARERDHGRPMRYALKRAGRTVIKLDAAHYERCCEALELTSPSDDGQTRSVRTSDASECGARRPSIGFVALLWYFHELSGDWRISLFNHTFGGRSEHPWKREREWIGARVAEGSIELVDDSPSIRNG